MSERSKKKIPFFKISKFFFEKWLQWDVANVDRNKLMKFELILSICGEITKDNLPGGGQKDPPGWLSLVISRWMLQMSSNFMTLFLSIFATSHWSHFSKKNFENLKNGIFFFNRSDFKGSPLWNFFFQNYFFPFF